MLSAIIADIHANLEAFQAVIADLESRMVEQVFCLGDLVGYGPDPEEVVRLFRSKGYAGIQGNHEGALHDARMRRWLNFQARDNSRQTENLLSASSRNFCCCLPMNLKTERALFVHGFPPASPLRYLTMASEADLQNYFEHATARICFLGHTHLLAMLSWDGHSLGRAALPVGCHRLASEKKYIINAGSVGQPRDGSHAAKYLLWDEEKDCLEVVAVEYDIQTTVKKIQERGFPAAYGLRLL